MRESVSHQGLRPPETQVSRSFSINHPSLPLTSEEEEGGRGRTEKERRDERDERIEPRERKPFSHKEGAQPSAFPMAHRKRDTKGFFFPVRLAKSQWNGGRTCFLIHPLQAEFRRANPVKDQSPPHAQPGESSRGDKFQRPIPLRIKALFIHPQRRIGRVTRPPVLLSLEGGEGERFYQVPSYPLRNSAWVFLDQPPGGRTEEERSQERQEKEGRRRKHSPSPVPRGKGGEGKPKGPIFDGRPQGESAFTSIGMHLR